MVSVIGHRDEIDHEATCTGCGSILSYRRPEVHFGRENSYGSVEYRYIDCPVCKEAAKDNPNLEQIGRVKVKL